jgi:hypothetical protein
MSTGDLDSSITEGSSPRSLEWNCSGGLQNAVSSHSLDECVEANDFIQEETSAKSDSSFSSANSK